MPVAAPDETVCLLVNPAAGGGRAASVLPAVEAELERLGVNHRTERTRDLDHARRLAGSAARAGETLVTLSGDGLVGCVAGVLREVEGSLLGVLPGGRGNDFARGLGIPLEPVAACAVIAEHNARALDVGFDLDQGKFRVDAPRLQVPRVGQAQLVEALALRPGRADGQIQPRDHRILLDGHIEPAVTAAANAQAYGGGMFVAPNASLDDGELDVVCTGRTSKLRFLRGLPKVFDGSHIDEPSVQVHRTREVRISADRPFTLYADGDPIAELPAVVRAVPGALRVLVPVTPATPERP